MPLPTSGPLYTNLIADEVGYTQSIQHNLAGPPMAGNTPGTYSLTYFFRPGNVASLGVTQVAPFGMSAFYGQEAIYRCVSFSPTGPTGSAEVVTYYKNLQTITFSSATNYCIRQNWDGQMAIKNTISATYTIGATCSAIGGQDGQSVPSQDITYGMYGVKVYNVGGYDINGNTGVNGTLSLVYNTGLYATGLGTYSNFWWAQPSPEVSGAGRLNYAGIWNNTNIPITGASGQYVGSGYLSFTLNIPSTRTYYVGVGGDNGVTIKLDNTLILSQTGSGTGFGGYQEPFQFINNNTDDLYYKYWHIYPITFSSGIRLLQISNNNYLGVGTYSTSSIGAFGVEVYGNTFSSLKNILDSGIDDTTGLTPSNIEIIYTSGAHSSAAVFYQNLGVLCPSKVTTTSTTTTTTTISPTFSYIDTNNTSSDISITNITVNGVAISTGTYSFPINTGQHTIMKNYQLGGSLTIRIFYSSTSDTQKITFDDDTLSTPVCSAVNVSPITFTNQSFGAGNTEYILAQSGSC